MRWIATLFFVLTAATVFRSGLFHAATFAVVAGGFDGLFGAANQRLALWYAVPTMAILAAHEGGHWLACRWHGIPTWGPFFLPWPRPFAGTMGAFIVMRESPRSANALWDVAIWGPVAGFLVTLVCLGIGLSWSVPVTGRVMARIHEFRLLSLLGGKDVAWHPLVMAGWLGLVLTAINLLPLPGLDGWKLARTAIGSWRDLSRGRRWSLVAVGGLCLACWL